jgi:hypothetical protein
MKTNISNRARAALATAGYDIASNPAIAALVAFAAQNPGLEPGNYISDPRDLNGRRAFASEARSISADWRRFKAALVEAGTEGVTDAQVIEAAPRAFSGRLGFVATCSLWGTQEASKVTEAKDHNGKPGYVLSPTNGKGQSSHQFREVVSIGVDYCTGQYFPTEYRKAAACVLEDAARIVRRSRPKVEQMPRSIAELKELNRANGGCWFEPSSMRFFGSRIESGIIRGRYFITSEQPPHGPRKYSVRSFDAKGSVDTVGEFCDYTTKADAMAAIPRE